MILIGHLIDKSDHSIFRLVIHTLIEMDQHIYLVLNLDVKQTTAFSGIAPKISIHRRYRFIEMPIRRKYRLIEMSIHRKCRFIENTSSPEFFE